MDLTHELNDVNWQTGYKSGLICCLQVKHLTNKGMLEMKVR